MKRVRSNPSIERTPYGMLRMPPVAAHVERYASAAVQCYWNVGLFSGLCAQSARWPMPRVSAALSVLGPFAPRLVRGLVVSAQASACSQLSATQTPRRESAQRERSLACAPRRSSSAAQHRLRRLERARTYWRSAKAAQSRACASVRGCLRSQPALHRVLSQPWVSRCGGAVRSSGASGPGSHNPSIERTPDGAAHVER
jgi:hypothetical protein